jgi:probable DNA metabolism protein
VIEASFTPDLEGWRNEARRLLQRNIPPDQILWPHQNEQSFFLGAGEEFLTARESPPAVFKVPPEFMNLARFVACSRDEGRWSLLYRILFRLKHETPHLLKIASDDDVQRAHVLMKSVTRDIHKMHAFVRFKHVTTEGQDIYMAWHRPEHLIVEEATPFFVRRFGDKNWCIFTPDRTATWDGQELKFSEGISQHLFPHKDDFDELWKSYYSSIFNPARLKIKAMKTEMSPKYWGSLPEAALIPDLIRQAPQRLEKMAKNQNIQASPPPTETLEDLYQAAAGCKACPLYLGANHMVPGEGPAQSEIMIVGEQPGDQEDLAGKAFVGPAGHVLNEQLQSAGLIRSDIYLTNAVKHFKFRQTEKLRLHQRPSGPEMHACRPWLEEEIKKVKPRIIVALGTTAATSVLGRLPKISQERGKVLTHSSFAEVIILSWHPAAILRAKDAADAAEKKQQLAADLALAREVLDSLKNKGN